jgi:hypothetical protein
MNTLKSRYQDIIKKLQSDDRNASWDEIIEDRTLKEAVDVLVDALTETIEPGGMGAEEVQYYSEFLVAAMKIKEDMKMSEGRVTISIPAEDMKKLYIILEHSALSNQDVYDDMEDDDPLRYANMFANMVEFEYHDQTGNYVRDIHFEWEPINTGGNTIVYYRDFMCDDGKIRMVGVNSESIVLYDRNFNEYWIRDIEPNGEEELSMQDFTLLLDVDDKYTCYKKFYDLSVS